MKNPFIMRVFKDGVISLVMNPSTSMLYETRYVYKIKKASAITHSFVYYT